MTFYLLSTCDDYVMGSFGFSLLELLFALMISAILASIGITGWRDMYLRHELSHTTVELMAFLNEVKMEANLHNTNRAIYLFETSATNWCLAVASKKRPAQCQTSFHFISSARSTEIIGLSTKATLTFYGKSNMAQSITIRLKNSIGESRIIISTRGRIRYCSYHTFLFGFPVC